MEQVQARAARIESAALAGGVIMQRNDARNALICHRCSLIRRLYRALRIAFSLHIRIFY